MQAHQRLQRMVCFLCLTFLLCTLARAEQIITLATRNGVTQSYLLLNLAYAFPSTVSIVFPGGNGVIGLKTVNGQATLTQGGNFLVRTRAMLRDSNVAVAVIDAPSDLQNTTGMSDEFRLGSDHAVDISAVVADLRTRFPGVRVHLVGTSRGVVSAAAIGAALGSGVQGVVLTSPVTVASTGQVGLSTFDYASLRSPVLMVGHVDDACSVSPYAGTLAVSQRYGYTPTGEAHVPFHSRHNSRSAHHQPCPPDRDPASPPGTVQPSCVYGIGS